jgi:Complex I intermediate-associated protein 30 (CIA30)
MSQSNRQPWDLVRFCRTLTYFNAIPMIGWLQALFTSAATPSSPQPPMALSQIWGALDDVVMGGVSASRVELTTEGALFTGTVSTANSGGFASIRTRNFDPPLQLSGYQGLELHLKGDGQRYKFLLRDEDTWDSVAYSYSFDTVADQWITVRIPFSELIPVFRAKTVRDGRSLNPQRIRSLQLMLSKFEYDGALNPHFTPGQFRLLTKTIRAF